MFTPLTTHFMFVSLWAQNVSALHLRQSCSNITAVSQHSIHTPYCKHVKGVYLTRIERTNGQERNNRQRRIDGHEKDASIVRVKKTCSLLFKIMKKDQNTEQEEKNFVNECPEAVKCKNVFFSFFRCASFSPSFFWLLPSSVHCGRLKTYSMQKTLFTHVL